MCRQEVHYPGYQMGFFRVQWLGESSVSAECRSREKNAAHHKELTKFENREIKVSGTQDRSALVLVTKDSFVSKAANLS